MTRDLQSQYLTSYCFSKLKKTKPGEAFHCTRMGYKDYATEQQLLALFASR